MTTLGRSPPRSKKGSSDASEVLTAGSIVADLEIEDAPDHVASRTYEDVITHDDIVDVDEVAVNEADVSEPVGVRSTMSAWTTY